jgi:hypothetical protein
LIVAAAVEREIFHLALADQARGLDGGNADGWIGVLNLHDLLDCADCERHGYFAALTDDERDARPVFGAESRLLNIDFVVADRQSRRVVLAGRIGNEIARCAGFGVSHGDARARNRAAGGVGHGAPDRSFSLGARARGPSQKQNQQCQQYCDQLQRVYSCFCVTATTSVESRDSRAHDPQSPLGSSAHTFECADRYNFGFGFAAGP